MRAEAEFLVAYRVWYRAHFMLEMYTALGRQAGNKSLYLLTPSGIAHLLWGAFLFVSCEYLKKRMDISEELTSQIDEIYKPLKRYRDAVFHPSGVLNPKSVILFLQNPDYQARAIDLHYAIRNYLRAHKLSDLLPNEQMEDFRSMGLGISLN